MFPVAVSCKEKGKSGPGIRPGNPGEIPGTKIILREIQVSSQGSVPPGFVNGLKGEVTVQMGTTHPVPHPLVSSTVVCLPHAKTCARQIFWDPRSPSRDGEKCGRISGNYSL